MIEENSVVLAQKAFEKAGYEVRVFGNGKEMAQAVLESVSADETVGIGGSVTVDSLGIYEALTGRGNRVYWHWKSDNANAARKSAMGADVYLMSSNAATLDGKLVNIDGTGNRVGALCYGPGRVIVLLGTNKLVKDEAEALERIRTIACPQNARRLKLDTPCARIGRCVDCASPQRMCKFRLTLDKAPAGRRISVYIAEEELGY